jgi:hypothetical protein
MSDVTVEIMVYHDSPNQEIAINLRGDTTLGNLRDIIHSCIGGRAVDRAWVSFSDQGRGLIPFSHTETESDALQLRFLRCSNEPDSPVAVGVFRYAVPIETQESDNTTAPKAGQGTKRTATEFSGIEAFDRSGYARV